MQFHELACSSLSLHELPWACIAHVPSVSIESLPKISVGVGGPDLVQHAVRADHRGDVWESHIVIVVLKELFLAAQFSEILTPSPKREPLITWQLVGKEQFWHNNCKIKIFYV